jgi:ApbE superfamily uncharacterized protein (UPF0280 family)
LTSKTGSDYVTRFYRDDLSVQDLTYLRVAVGESDLMIGVSAQRDLDPNEDALVLSRLREEIAGELVRVRRGLKAYIYRHPSFRSSLVPLEVEPEAPPLVREMAEAAAKAGVGPMAAVAGAIAQAIGRFLMNRFEDVVVENGGDIFLQSSRSRIIGVYAGRMTKLSGRLAIRLGEDRFPIGVCTSAGTVGPSLSFGSSDATTVISKDAALADAAATAVGNRVVSESDIGGAIEFGSRIPGVEGIVVVKGVRFGTWGRVELV